MNTLNDIQLAHLAGKNIKVGPLWGAVHVCTTPEGIRYYTPEDLRTLAQPSAVQRLVSWFSGRAAA